MPTTKAIIVNKVMRRLNAHRSEADKIAWRDDIESWLPAACHRLAMQMKDNQSSGALLTRSIAITFAAGAASLPDTGDMLIASIPNATIFLDAVPTKPFFYVPSEWDLRVGRRSTRNVIYTITKDTSDDTGSKLITRGTDGSLTSVAGAATINGAVYIPVVAASSGSTTLPFEMEDPLIDILVSMASNRPGMAQGR